ncbi:MAG: metallophosphoesterase [Methylobacter sp.]|uniref:metallophosphoesterase n=1 Tax=Methylobacter sp. TaxID=2051955 RepID=UPI0025CE8416|nr:metallophosphoesterase [Methylobacter sp.]MCK9622732.1 metallophosphoesterase [Methylobacter sp.]
MNRRSFIKSAFSGGAFVLAGSYPIFIERNIVQVNRYKIPIPNLPLSFHGFTLAHLTDIHLGFLVPPSFVEEIVHRTNRLNTDAIVCTGDYVHNRNTIEEIDKVWPILSKLSARYGVYSVLGNHDHWGDSSRSLYWLERSGQNVRHQCKAIYKGKDRILIGGAGDFWGDKLNIDKAFSGSDQGDCRILLAHNPDSVDTEFETPLSLVLSGHTHGGQVVFPFLGAPKLPVKNKAYSSGLIATPRTPLFISRGIGWAILPVRFNCYPEIAVLELVNPSLAA